MNRHWLPWLSIGVIGGIVLLLFALRLRPAWTPGENSVPVVAKLERPTVTFVDPSVGPTDARVTIVGFSDFQCAPCADELAALRAVQAAYPEDVRLVWKHLPNDSVHPLAIRAAVAAQCAQRQGAFWPYAESLFARQSGLTADQFTLAAQETGLKTAAFASCLEVQDTLAIVEKHTEEGLALRITATPTIFVNDVRYVGAHSIQELSGYVNAALEK